MDNQQRELVLELLRQGKEASALLKNPIIEQFLTDQFEAAFKAFLTVPITDVAALQAACVAARQLQAFCTSLEGAVASASIAQTSLIELEEMERRAKAPRFEEGEISG